MRGRFSLLAVMIVVGASIAVAQTPPPAASVPGPTLASAEKMLTAARAKATEMGVNLTCVVVDVHGDLVAAARMDGVLALTVDVAQGKARTSAFFGQPSGGMG